MNVSYLHEIVYFSLEVSEISEERRAFIISPIGDEGSKERKHADNVLNYIIEPAMKECGIHPERSDKISKLGLITNEITDSIMNYDMSIAVLAFENRNVYYELAIAQAASKPVIILKHCDEQIPFDISGYKYVEYDLEDTKKIMEGVYVKIIVDFIKSIEESDWKMSSSIGDSLITKLSLITTEKERDLQYFEKSDSYGKWVDILNDTENIFYIMGISLNAWIGTQNLAGKLAEKAKDGCKIKILLLHKDNPAINGLINDKISQIGRERFLYMMDDNWEKFNAIAEDHENIEVRRLRMSTMTHTKYINDNYGFYVPYFYSKITNNTPLWKSKRGTYLYKILLEDFEFLWSLSE